MQPRFRFAPSPNGYLHQGHAYSLFENARLAKVMKGELILRIEDIDITRVRDDYVSAIFEDTEWLGFNFSRESRRQSKHFYFYQQAIQELMKHDLLYPSFETRAEVQALGDLPKDPEGAVKYPLPYNFISKETERFALRLNMQKALKFTGKLTWQDFITGETHEVDGEKWGDVVIKRKEITTSYHLSVTLDDNFQNITHVVRGEDLFHATDVHIILQKLLNLSQPLYYHHPLIKDEAGEKLAKSKASTPLRELRAQGINPKELFR